MKEVSLDFKNDLIFQISKNWFLCPGIKMSKKRGAPPAPSETGLSNKFAPENLQKKRKTTHGIQSSFLDNSQPPPLEPNSTLNNSNNNNNKESRDPQLPSSATQWLKNVLDMSSNEINQSNSNVRIIKIYLVFGVDYFDLILVFF